jgi:hypothetical protein
MMGLRFIANCWGTKRERGGAGEWQERSGAAWMQPSFVPFIPFCIFGLWIDG